MAWMQDVAEERTERAFRFPVGAASPLWMVFGAAAVGGAAYWWMNSWRRAWHAEAALAPMAPPRFSPLSDLAHAVGALVHHQPHAPEAEDAAPVAEAVEAATASVVDAAAQTAEAVVEPAAETTSAVADTVVEAVDDLTRMTGVGPKLSAALAERGVTRFAQIAAWTEADLADVDVALSLKGRAVREAWVAQARRLAHAN
jgi:predicted flap endonuclease-1-like 5' DNA nuclease